MQDALRINKRGAWSSPGLREELKAEGYQEPPMWREGWWKSILARKGVYMKTMRWETGSVWLEFWGVR